MNKHILIILLLAVTTFNFGCRQASNEKQDDPAAPKDSVVSQPVTPSKSGYAEVNIPMLADRQVIVAEMQGHGRQSDVSI